MDYCKRCSNITLESRDSNDDVLDLVAVLHPSLTALEESASRHSCRLCVMLLGMIEHRALGKPFETSTRSDCVELSISYLEDGDWMGDDTDTIRHEPEHLIFKHPLGLDSFLILNPTEISRQSWHQEEKNGLPSNVVANAEKANILDGASQLDTSTGSDVALSLASSWMKYCRENHFSCRDNVSSGARQLPTRLIWVSKATSHEEKVFLVGSKHTFHGQQATDVRYATLSHRWDPHQSSLTTTSNENTHIVEGLRVSQLPKTFAEACITAKKLGIEYIWIDSLCILQDSEEDKLREIPKMAIYYQNADVNLSASAANPGGLWRQRTGLATRPLTLPITIVFPGPNQRSKSVMLSLAPVLRGPKSQLDSRGWILQERIFPARTLFFEPYWISFECGQWSASENRPRGLPINATTRSQERENKMGTHLGRDCSLAVMGTMLRNINIQASSNPATPSTGNEAKSSAYVSWYRIVKEYSQRQLSFEADRLPAIAGIAERLSSILGDRYFGGMWESEIISCLQWMLTTPTGYGKLRFLPYRAPTWSWASLDMSGSPQRSPFVGVIYDQEVVEKEEREAIVVDVSWNFRTANIYGDLADARLVVKGRPMLGHAHLSATFPDSSEIPATMDEELEDGPAEQQVLRRTVDVTGNKFWFFHVLGVTAEGARGLVAGRLYLDFSEDMTEGPVHLLPISRRFIGGGWDCFCLVLRVIGDGIFQRIGWTKTVPRFMPLAKERIVILV